MSLGSLTPNIDQRVAAWIKHDKERNKQKNKILPCVTISRTFGCEAYPLSAELKKILEKETNQEWIIYDKSLLQKVAQEKRLSEEFLGRLGDASHFFDKLSVFFPNMMTHDEAYKEITRYLVKVAHQGNAIIVGLGGAVITKELPSCFHFRLEGPLSFRIHSIANRLKVSIEEATLVVNENTQLREKFLENYLNTSISDPLLYEAIFNNAKVSVSEISVAIYDLIKESIKEFY